MGHTLDEWIGKVGELLKDFAGVDLDTSDIESLGLRPAFVEHSANHPREVTTEVAGAGSGYFDLPDLWEAGRSYLTEVEYPARQTTVQVIDSRHYTVTRSIADVDVEQIRLRYLTPTASQYVRFTFAASWPFPAEDEADDALDDSGFEAVSQLAAAYCCESLQAEAARDRSAAMPTDLASGTDRGPRLAIAAERFRESYKRLSRADWFVA